MIFDAINEYIDGKEAQMLEFWRDLVRIESPSSCKEGVDRVGARISAFCENELGYHIRYQYDDVYGNCLAACSCPFSEFVDGIVISAHMDTVHPIGFFDPLLEEDENCLYGPGAGDCKGGIVLALLTAAALKKSGYKKRPIKLLFAADEESGGPSGRSFYSNELSGAAVMFNAESGLFGKIVTGRKSSIIATFDIVGKAAHIGYINGMPVNANREAALKLLALENASDYDHLTFCGSTIQGGTVATSVSNQCRLEVNVRIKTEKDIERAMDLLRTVANTSYVEGSKCVLTIRGNTQPMDETKGNLWLCRHFNDAAAQLGYPLFDPVIVGGASDASYASMLQIPVICATGPVVEYQHTRNERVWKHSMAQRAKIHTAAIWNLPDTLPNFDE